MIDQHARVIHLVDMIARQDHHIFGVVTANDVQVLVHRIRRALVPVLGTEALLGRQQIDKLIHLFVEERPAALNMLHQGMRLVLGDHTDAADPRIQAVRQGKINDAEFTAKVDGRLGTG
ncbi:hypothetical protein D3C78_1139510 [compost metagenome]